MGETENVYKKQIKHQNTSCSLNPTLECTCWFPSTFWRPAIIQAVPLLMVESLLDCSAREVIDAGQAPVFALLLFCWHLANSKPSPPPCWSLDIASGGSNPPLLFPSVLKEKVWSKGGCALRSMVVLWALFFAVAVNYSSVMESYTAFSVTVVPGNKHVLRGQNRCGSCWIVKFSLYCLTVHCLIV